MSIIEEIKTALANLAGNGLSDTKHATRAAALTARLAEIDGIYAEQERAIKAQLAAARSECAARKQAAERQAAETRRARGRRNLETFYERVRPHVVSWIEEPTRKSADAICAAMADANTVALEETGEALLDGALAFAFADALASSKPALLVHLGELYGTHAPASVLEPCELALKSLHSIVDFRAALDRLEAALMRLPDAVAASELSRTRYDACRNGPCRDDVHHAMHPGEREREAELEAARAVARPPVVKVRINGVEMSADDARAQHAGRHA